MRHADTVDGLVLGFTGSRRRPHHLALVVGDKGAPAWMSARLEPVLAARIGEALGGAEVVGERRAEGELYTRVETDLVVAALAGYGSARHPQCGPDAVRVSCRGAPGVDRRSPS
ncbi:hypothetical protein [Streptomyces pulveraceus]|uniref:Uncharacterized protein n=1 Tax=Streptomyces pulveraceus TaxID=68258 RepID=A0ABW1GM96_9ACTN